MLELTRLALRSFSDSIDPASAEVEHADEEMADLDEFEAVPGAEYETAPAISGPWSADHFPRAPSDTEVESDELY